LIVGWCGQFLFFCFAQEDKASRSISGWLGPVTDIPPLLIEKGYEDHLTVLISTKFTKKVEATPST